MIGTISVRETAKNSNFPLQPIYAFTSAPSHVRLIDLPKQIGTWKITSVSVSAVYPDGTSLISPCTLVGGCWSTTFSGCSTTGKVENGATVLADGIDELGQNVVGYVLGKGDIVVLDGSMEVSPDQPQTVFMRICISGDVDDPKLGTMADINGWKVYTLSGWQSLGMTPSDLSGKADLSDVQTLSAEVSAKADLSAVNAATAAINEALSDRPTKSQVEAGWWSEWTIFFQGSVDERFVVVASGNSWLLYDAENDFIVSAVSYDENASSLDFGNGYTAARRRVAAPVPVNASDLSAADLSTVNEILASLSAKQDALTDAQLSAINAEVDSRKTYITLYDDASVLEFDWSGEVNQQTMVDADLYDATVNVWKRPISKIKFGSAVTSIGENTFNAAVTLYEVFMSDSITSIGNNAFGDCASVEFDKLPNNLTSIGTGAFENCGSITYMSIPSEVKTIGPYAFYGCYQMTNVTIPNNVKTIGQHAFDGCHYLERITIPETVTSIGQYAFFDCTDLRNVTICSDSLTIGSSTFEACTMLANVMFKLQSTQQVSAMANYPFGISDTSIIHCELDTASKQWVESQLSAAFSGLNENSTTSDIVAALKSLI